MPETLRDSFLFSAFAGNESLEIAGFAANDVVATLKRLDAWIEGSIHPKGGADFPRVVLSFHRNHGFVLQCYEDERSFSEFLVTGDVLSPPAFEMELGGQALERWPAELFVSEEVAVEAIEWFLDSGKQKPALNWVRIDGFPREVVWDDRASRNAWERAHRISGGDA